MKKNKKIIVNVLTLSRIFGTILMPIMYNFLSAPIFILIVGLLLLTDSLDGILARHWKVSTIFGSLADMTADKLLAFSILIILSMIYPIMIVPLAFETIIASINIKNTLIGSLGESSKVGKTKTWILGVSMITLLFIGLSPELCESLLKIKIDKNIFNDIKNTLINEVQNFIKSDHKTIEYTAITSSIAAESVTLADYMKDKPKTEKENNIRKQINELKKYKSEIIKNLFDEEYFETTKDLPLIKKLVPKNLKEE